jgi:hypothetical protein
LDYQSMEDMESGVADKNPAELREKRARYHQLVQMRAAEGKCLAHAASDGIRRSIRVVLDVLDQQIEILDTDIKHRI